MDEVKVGPWNYFEFENGYMEDTGNGLVSHLNDGRIIDYTLLSKGERLEKLWECVRCVEEKRAPVCTLKTAKEHTHAVLLAQEKGVVDLSSSAEARLDDKESTYYTIPGLGKALQDAYKSWTTELNLI